MSLIGHVRLQPSSGIAEWDTLNHLCFLSSVCNWSPVEQTCLLSTPHSQGVPCWIRGVFISILHIAYNLILIPYLQLDFKLISKSRMTHCTTHPDTTAQSQLFNWSERHNSQLGMPSPPLMFYSRYAPVLMSPVQCPSPCPRRLDHPVSALCPVSVCVFGRKIDQSRHFLWEILLL